MHDPLEPEDETEGADPVRLLTIGPASGGLRLDKALSLAAEGDPEGQAGLSRSRLAQAIAEGRVSDPTGATVLEVRRKVKAGETYRIVMPAPVPVDPQPEAIPLSIVHEDAHLIVVDKPAGMVVHPAPGAETGTLVNALLHHCGDGLSGIGGERRPGIVHRIDKDTSGLLVVAKSEAALAGLSTLFATHDIDRSYLALVWGVPDRGDPRLAGLPGVSLEADGWIRVETQIARHPSDRKRMAVARAGGRRAVTWLAVRERFREAPAAALLEASLETGRTHQIRVHAKYIGYAMVGDPVYGRSSIPPQAGLIATFPRQALHAQRLGFRHPIGGDMMTFEAAPPPDMATLIDHFRRR